MDLRFDSQNYKFIKKIVFAVEKYVNSADIFISTWHSAPTRSLDNVRFQILDLFKIMKEDSELITTPITSREVPQLENIELLFFAYRDFVGDADRILAEFGFGRAHHRALYFVNRKPGMTVAELLETLKITKQSLARVLRQLVGSGYITQATETTDKRKRLLYPTRSGRELVLALSAPQSRRIDQALKQTGEPGSETVTRFMQAMIGKS